MLAHASHIAQLAAQCGAEIAAGADGSIDVLQNARRESLGTANELGAHLVNEPQLVSTSSLVGMKINVKINGIVPFLPTDVERTVWVSKEEFVLEQNR